MERTWCKISDISDDTFCPQQNPCCNKFDMHRHLQSFFQFIPRKFMQMLQNICGIGRMTAVLESPHVEKYDECT